jgi:TetR/AcrR family transcriptional regulator, transcriptional repressor for nem operon
MRKNPPIAQSTRNAGVDTPARILDVAEQLVQIRGFNGFSYADVAAELEITKASLHYHFNAKSDLGEALIERYAARFTAALEAIDAREKGAPAKLQAYAQIYAGVLREGRMCLCGMLAADYETLPQAMREAVIRFFDESEAWLAGVLKQGEAEGTVSLDGGSAEAAQAIVSGLEGALLVARPYRDVERFEAAAKWLLASIANAPATSGGRVGFHPGPTS